jgi:hypothetical protein
MRLITLLLILAFVPDTAEASPIDLTSGVMTPQNYNPAALVTTANKLIALGPEDGYQSLLALANSPNFKFDFQRDYYVAWLCLLV